MFYKLSFSVLFDHFPDFKNRKLTSDVLDDLNYQFMRRLQKEGLVTQINNTVNRTYSTHICIGNYSTTDNTEDNVIEDDSSGDYDTSDTDTSDSDDGTEVVSPEESEPEESESEVSVLVSSEPESS